MRKKEPSLDPKYIYKGDVILTKENITEWNQKLKGITKIRSLTFGMPKENYFIPTVD